MTILFTSDTHYMHGNIIKYCKRPFADREVMTKALIDNWNAVVSQQDTVYHLGDVSFCGDVETKEILDQLNGTIILMIGNHDRNIRKHLNSRYGGRFAEIHTGQITVELDGQSVMMSHYPVYDRDFINAGGWMLHGHCHGTMEPRLYRMLDVGVDSHKFKPITLQEVSGIMSTRTTVLR